MEAVQFGDAVIPRIFMGLWQFSSPAWGTASEGKIRRDFRKHVYAGFVAYGMSQFSISFHDFSNFGKAAKMVIHAASRHG